MKISFRKLFSAALTAALVFAGCSNINDVEKTFNPCNAAMYSRCIYNTDNFLTWKVWHDTIVNKQW